ncbi:hypothetical protein B9T31_02275 [Acinetobacter sp. ANC 4558]|uniref:hypothetical protein n=1 Tax=Acinetobacter sp. ANC 4558 TaxID=1977876 RepID=UPI000A3451BE|nr:hypothetical protein [Acinetobacter sp. ANC 4558]OTG88357.1 hypothetical protein B9T31_02275 [Acinetobacter sp. ANC 4558]
MNAIKLIELEQIYNFIAEYPEILSKTNFDRIRTFISVYHNDRGSEINICDENFLQIKYHGGIMSLDLNSVPNFLHKSDFITWCTNNLIH